MGLFGSGQDSQQDIDRFMEERDHLDYNPLNKEEVEEDYREAVLRVWDQVDDREEWLEIADELYREYELWIHASE